MSADPDLPDAAALAALAHALIHTRHTVLPKRLVAPGPDAAQQRLLFEAAAAAPDHEQRQPWRFVLVPEARRADLAEVFAAALQDRDPTARPEQLAQAREKAYRAPLVVLAVARLDPADAAVPAAERLVSLGCALQNMLLTAHALGFASALTSGQGVRSPRLRQLFALGDDEQAVCFFNVGTALNARPGRPRPRPEQFVSSL